MSAEGLKASAHPPSCSLESAGHQTSHCLSHRHRSVASPTCSPSLASNTLSMRVSVYVYECDKRCMCVNVTEGVCMREGVCEVECMTGNVQQCVEYV